MDVKHDDTRPAGGVAMPVDADAQRVTAQQLGCLKTMTELLFAQIRRDLASVSDDPARAVERTVSAAEQRYRDCLEVYGAAMAAAGSRPSHPALGPSSPPWGHPDVDGSPGDLLDPGDAAGSMPGPVAACENCHEGPRRLQWHAPGMWVCGPCAGKSGRGAA